MKNETTKTFLEITKLIQSARQRAYRAVNSELVTLYWQVGEYISGKIASAEWGEGIVDQLAKYLAETQPGLRGFTRPNLFRMRQLYETYVDDKEVSPLVTQLPWTHNLIILSRAKRAEEREFYLRMSIREHWSKRELERQFKASLFERKILMPPKVSPLARQMQPLAEELFKDSHSLEFLGLSESHDEADLHGALLRKKHENPAIGMLLCATKDEEVVEYALSRSLSPSMVAEYQTQMPDKKLLQAKLHEFYELLAPAEEEEAP